MLILSIDFKYFLLDDYFKQREVALKKEWLVKTLTLDIVILCICAGIVPTICARTNNNFQEELTLSKSSKTLEAYVYGIARIIYKTPEYLYVKTILLKYNDGSFKSLFDPFLKIRLYGFQGIAFGFIVIGKISGFGFH